MKVASTGWPNQVPLTVAVRAPMAFTGHMGPRGNGAKGFFACSRTRQDFTASGCVPPTGSQRRVQRRGGAPGPVTLMTRDTAAGLTAANCPAPAGDAGLEAWRLPHAVAAAAQTAAISRYRAPAGTRSVRNLMPIGRSPSMVGSGSAYLPSAQAIRPV